MREEEIKKALEEKFSELYGNTEESTPITTEAMFFHVPSVWEAMRP